MPEQAKPKSPAKPAEKPAGERIAKVLSRAGVASRREAERMIEAGEVKVNGRVIDSPALNVTAQDRITVNGRPLAEQRGELARSLLWIGHAEGIKGLLTAEENLTWLCALHQPASREAIWAALAAVGLRGFEDVPCHTLSAGQQRRVALARLYLASPPLWILDEPFTALDKQGVAQLEAHLAAHCEQGGTVVLTTHHTLERKPSGYRELNLGQWAA